MQCKNTEVFVGRGHFKHFVRRWKQTPMTALGVETGLLNRDLEEIKYSLLGCDAMYLVRYVHITFTFYTENGDRRICKEFLPICKVTRRHMPGQVIVMFTVVVTLNLIVVSSGVHESRATAGKSCTVVPKNRGSSVWYSMSPFWRLEFWGNLCTLRSGHTEHAHSRLTKSLYPPTGYAKVMYAETHRFYFSD
jgi:hypothetical protein